MEDRNTSAVGTIVEPPQGGSIMAIAAHPDDIESWCAGTLARAIDRGATVRLLLVTSGNKGSSDPSSTSEHVARIREAEAREAASQLGIAAVAFLRYPDGEVEDTRALRRDLVTERQAPAARRAFGMAVFKPIPDCLCGHHGVL